MCTKLSRINCILVSDSKQVGRRGRSGWPLAGSPSPASLGREINWPLYYREPRHKSRVLIVSAPVGGRRRARGQNPLPSRLSQKWRAIARVKETRKKRGVRLYLTRQRYPQIAVITAPRDSEKYQKYVNQCRQVQCGNLYTDRTQTCEMRFGL